jgi:hypothetical protein
MFCGPVCALDVLAAADGGYLRFQFGDVVTELVRYNAGPEELRFALLSSGFITAVTVDMHWGTLCGPTLANPYTTTVTLQHPQARAAVPHAPRCATPTCAACFMPS